MPFATLNGATIEHGILTLVRSGVCTADLVIELPVPPVGAVQITLGADSSLLFAGTVQRGGASRGASILRVIGGAGGLQKVLAAKGYRGVTVKLVLTELLTAAGEKLSALADPSLLAVNLASWARLQEPACVALAALMHVAPGATWRIGSDGTVWVGTEPWPQTQLGDYLVTKDDPQYARQEIAANVPNVYPGELLAGRQVSTVEHRIDPTAPRATIFYES